MTDALLAYGIDKMKEYGIVDSGNAKKYGIGAMTDARWREFFDTMADGRRLSEGSGFSPRRTHCNSSTRRSGCGPDRTGRFFATAAAAPVVSLRGVNKRFGSG